MKKLSEPQINEQLQNLSGWQLKEGNIVKTFKFNDFKQTFAIMTRIAFECEAQNHHPEWENVYNTLTIKLNTHDAGGVTQYDFDLAHAIENIVHTN